MEVGREQALAFRLAAHNLHRRLPAGAAEEAAAVAGLQDLPPGGASQALAARVESAQPGDVDALVIVYGFRGAAIAVPRRDLAVFTTALMPPDEAAARVLIGTATESLDAAGLEAREALELVSAAVADALAAEPLARDAFHQALRERLPGYDPYLDQRDRDTLLPDRELRARVRRPIGNPGVVLVDGDLAGLWRPAKKGRRLVLTVEPVTPAARGAAAAIEPEAALLAPHRGCEVAEVRWA